VVTQSSTLSMGNSFDGDQHPRKRATVKRAKNTLGQRVLDVKQSVVGRGIRRPSSTGKGLAWTD